MTQGRLTEKWSMQPLVRKNNTLRNKKVIFMSEKKKEEFETPNTVDIEKLAETVAKKTAEEMAKKMTPAAQPTALTEKTEGKKEPDPTAYRKQLVEHFKKEAKARGPLDLKETIGGASASAMAAWATDVFRCCPYPASALCNPKRVARIIWDAPFIKWHEDIHGRISEVFSEQEECLCK